jgi:pimeloyl-ACP methyl ester carboxylesterase
VAVSRPRILLVPTLTELEWEKIEPLIAEWAEVASYDAPGVGSQPATEGPFFDARVAQGLAQLDSLGWDRCVIAGDEFGAAFAIHLAAARPEAVQGLALGHPCLSFRRDGERAPINQEVLAALEGVLRVDYRSYVRAVTQVTQQAYDDELADRYRERVPAEVSRTSFDELLSNDERVDDFEPLLRRLGVPMLLAEHRGCLLWTREGYEGAVAAFPEATTASMPAKPSVSPEFVKALRSFCEALVPAEDLKEA